MMSVCVWCMADLLFEQLVLLKLALVKNIAFIVVQLQRFANMMTVPKFHIRPNNAVVSIPSLI
jgi:hypothetical protein